ncbi:hypothetical protein CWM41_28400, partial [Escherichia coli]|uniref:homocysteine S-methyltransferase family protein n=1 Tax=Escherichia coli TaxID=562 RepID=UPI000CAC4B12
LAGLSPEALCTAVRRAEALTLGLDCALGPDELRQHVQELSRVAESYVAAPPDAKPASAFGEYELEADTMAKQQRERAQAGFLN